MELGSNDLEARIEVKQRKIASLKEKRAEIETKIRKEEADLNRLTMMSQSAHYDVLKAAAEQSGYSMEDLLELLRGSGQEPDDGEI